MPKKIKKTIKRIVVLAFVIAFVVYLPWVALFFLVCGILDFMRNKHPDHLAMKRYFLGNGILTWVLSPFNLLLDLISRKNPGVYKLEDFPDDYRAEIEDVLGVFKDQKDRIISDIDETLGDATRGMYVYRWYSKKNITNIEALNKDYKYLKTIAVSVFKQKESTKWHYGPMRLSIRILYNLTPVERDDVFIECQGQKHLWYKEPFYAFDDTLFHRSVNEADSPRYVVFMDIARPSYFPGAISSMMAGFSAILERFKSVFYKNWKMLEGAKR